MKKNRMVFVASIGVIIVIILLITDISFALGDGIELYGINFRPIFRLQQQYDSNVFLDERDEKTDFITSVGVGSNLEVEMGDVSLEGGYLFDMNLFAEHDDQNSYNHTVTAKIDWNLTDYEVIVNDKYRRFSTRAGTEDTDRLSRQNNILSLDVLAEFNRLAFDVGYDFVVEDFLSNEFVSGAITYDEAEDRFEHTFRAEASHRTFPKTSLLAEVDFGLIEYESSFNPESYFIQTLIGARGDWFGGAMADIKVGFRYQDYEGSEKDFANVVAKSTVTKNFGQKDTITLSIERSVNESTYRDMSYYCLNYFGLDYIHQFNDKWSASLGSSYQINLYPRKTTENRVYDERYDNYYGGRCGLRYNIQKWLSTEVSYRYTQRESRFANFDYIANLVSIEGIIQF